MTADRQPLRLRPYGVDDFPLLRASNTEPMTRYLGGPESEEKLLDRHRRYLEVTALGTGHMFVIEAGPSATTVGSIGYWDKSWHAEHVYETGWGILPAFQGRGLATAAIGLAVRHAREHGSRTWIHAFPNVDNTASNAICRKAGFELVGPAEFEYPPGHRMVCNDWRLDLTAAPQRYREASD